MGLCKLSPARLFDTPQMEAGDRGFDQAAEFGDRFRIVVNLLAHHHIVMQPDAPVLLSRGAWRRITNDQATSVPLDRVAQYRP